VVAYGLQPDNPIPLTEESPLRPNENLYYSRAKAAIEKYLDMFEIEQPNIIVTRLRPCTVIGPQADPAQMTSLTSSSAVLAKGFDPPYQLLHEQDLAKALYFAIQDDIPGTYNVTSDDPLPLGELAISQPGGKVVRLPFGIARALMGLSWYLRQSVFAPEWADLIRYPLVASNQKLKHLGWKPDYSTAEAYADLRAAWKEREEQ
jgi:UDP-glucose 4-epimerase